MSKTVNPKTGKFCSFHLVGTVQFEKDKYGILEKKTKYVWYAGENLPKSVVSRSNSTGKYKKGYVHIPESYEVDDNIKNRNNKIPVRLKDFKENVKLVKECNIENMNRLNKSEIVEIIREAEPDFKVS